MTSRAPFREFALRGGLDAGRRVRVLERLKGDRYEVIDILADGGMGILFRARDHRTGGNLVLIKAVKYDTGEFGYDRRNALYHVYRMRQQFKREKNILMEMAHRGVNQVPNINDFFHDRNPELEREFPFGWFDATEELVVPGGQVEVPVGLEPFVVMERIMGRSVRDMVGHLTEARTLEIARSVCLLLDRVHRPRGRPDGTELSFVYMDLKPDNLLVDGHGGVWLVDFGAAIPVVDGVRKGKGAYTPGFAAPEVRRIGHPSAVVDARADLYSLGAILFQALSRGRVDPMSLARPTEDEFPVLPIDALRGDIHPLTLEVVTRSLARDPEERFASAGQMRLAIDAALRAV